MLTLGAADPPGSFSLIPTLDIAVPHALNVAYVWGNFYANFNVFYYVDEFYV